jgi:hypothetical protein
MSYNLKLVGGFRDEQNISMRLVVVIIFVTIVVGYSFFQARKILGGPQIKIDEPQNGTVFEEPLVVIRGRTRNINSIFLNDRPIFIDDEGYLSEKLLLSAGYNIIELQAKDRFGKTTEERLELVYLEKQATMTPLQDSATSTPRI